MLNSNWAVPELFRTAFSMPRIMHQTFAQDCRSAVMDLSQMLLACKDASAGSMQCIPDTQSVALPVVFADPAKYAGRVVPVVRERISWPQAAQILSEVTGIPVRCAC